MPELDRQREEQWLQKVMAEIKTQLQEAGVTSAVYRRRASEVRQLIWDDLQISSASRDIYDELAQHLVQLGEERGVAMRKYYQLRKLLTMQNNPYFGRFDFKEEGQTEPEAFYVGLGSLIDQKTGLPMVYDWRAPISSIFYDFGLGPASYTAPDGEIWGEVTKKRQYKIEHGKLIYMLETDLKIDDEMLQRALSANTDETMRTIVTTIQKEQNQAIRYEDKPVLVVTGPAGSGKTSVALHRVAYLLYKHREDTTANDVIIFSPSKVFSEYIADVLPELGEENVLQTTFQAFAGATLGGVYQCESLMEFQEKLASSTPSEMEELLARLKNKNSPEFSERLQQTLHHCLTQGVVPQDVSFGSHLIMSKDQLAKLIFEEYQYLPFARRLAKARRLILTRIRPLKKEQIRKRYCAIREEVDFHGEGHWEWARRAIAPIRAEYKATLRKLDQWLTIDPVGVYLEMLAPEERDQTTDALNRQEILFEDVAPLLFLIGQLEGFPVQRKIRQVVIDEGQDYSEMQLKIIQALFPRAHFTILGDENQRLNPSLSERNGLTSVTDVFPEGTVERFYLTKTYRSTQEITRFCLALLPEADRGNVVPLIRNGSKPCVTPVTPTNHSEKVSERIQEMLHRGNKSIAVICRSAVQAKEVHGALYELNPSLIVSEYSTYHSGLVVIPYYLAKGLEFDAVVIWDANASHFGEPYHRYQLYVACSRALHELAVFYTEEPSPFLREIPQEMFQLLS